MAALGWGRRRVPARRRGRVLAPPAYGDRDGRLPRPGLLRLADLHTTSGRRGGGRGRLGGLQHAIDSFVHGLPVLVLLAADLTAGASLTSERIASILRRFSGVSMHDQLALVLEIGDAAAPGAC